ncbi:glycosyltransferase [Maridesulfovibrio sp.]|uniref:glycosyltransferase family protein n=1 Tax=Maridesulfovibrio sp. TaxID=2795000 RepID=UPI0039EFA31F
MHKLLLINCIRPLVDAFEGLGCDVKHFHVQEREFDIAARLAEMDFEPDILLQQEYLGRRLFLRGLHELDCIKIFWSVDTHMNMFWHAYYADLFDCVLTTQKKFVPKLKKECSAAVEWMPWMAIPSKPDQGTGLVPHTRREHDITFVGRVSSHRRSRKWFLNFLESRYNLNSVDGLNFAQMMEVYRKTRIVPNEAIFGEVNFRLFEAASSACAVVTPYVGEELGELFEIGSEIAVYNDVLELKVILDRLTKDKSLSGSVGMAAYARVLKDHLPRSRAVSILDIAGNVSKRTISNQREELLLCMCEFLLGEAGDAAVDWNRLLRRLLSLESCELRDATLFRIYTRSGKSELFMKAVRPYLEKNSAGSGCYFNMTASLCAAKLDQWEVAKHFWYTYSSKGKIFSAIRPENNVHLLKLWGEAMYKCGLSIRSGVAFNEIEGIPSCASDCYFAALYRNPSDKDIYNRLGLLFRAVQGGEPDRLGFLSHLSLHYPENWRISADVGILNLKVFRMEEGLTELDNARVLAERSGQERFFKRKMDIEVPLYNKLLN